MLKKKEYEKHPNISFYACFSPDECLVAHSSLFIPYLIRDIFKKNMSSFTKRNINIKESGALNEKVYFSRSGPQLKVKIIKNYK
jgi:hypothetical protein